MAILKRKPVSFTDKYEDALNWVENQPLNFSKYVCELITKDMKDKQGETDQKVINKDPKQNKQNRKKDNEEEQIYKIKISMNSGADK